MTRVGRKPKASKALSVYAQLVFEDAHRLGIKYDTLAHEVGTTRTTIFRWCAGESDIPLTKFERLRAYVKEVSRQ